MKNLINKSTLRKTITLMLSVCMLVGVLTGCGGAKVDAAGSCKALYDLYVLQDKQGVLDMGMPESDADTALKAYDDTMASTMKSLFVTNGLTVDDDTVKDLVAARKGALNKLSCTTEIASSSGKTATVTLKTSYIKEEEIATKAAEDAIKQLEDEKETNQTKRIEIASKYFAENLIEGYKNAEVSDDQKELSVECGLTSNVWMPSDMTGFGTKLGQAISGQ